MGPARSAESLGQFDLVLLSHDHHYDNLDIAGRKLLERAGKILTTPTGAKILGDRSQGLAPWQTIELPTPVGAILLVTGTPARHGPAVADRGPVTGFLLVYVGSPESAVYISGDTVRYEGVAEVSRRSSVKVAILFMGAARDPEVGPWNLTMSAQDGAEVAHANPAARIIPSHFAGWAHFSESRTEKARAFASAELDRRLPWLEQNRESLFQCLAKGEQS